jgi:chorismate dehydratase
MTIVIGSVPYLNARPLVNWFYTDEGKASCIEVVERPPTELAGMLIRGEIDVAMVSSFATFQHPEYSIVPGISISGRGEIRSVRAFSKIPFSMIHSCAMDTSSLTSVAMLTILLAEVYNSVPQKLNCKPDLQEMLSLADAALLIGDPGMLADGSGLQILDLGTAWAKKFRLPFVYAAWIGPKEKLTDHLVKSLQTAKEYGITRFNELAEEEAIRLNVPVEECLSYFHEVMDYDLTDEHREGLSLFHSKCREYSLIHANQV